MKAVLDTSALISLEVSGLLPDALKLLDVTIPPTVFEELKELSKFDDIEGKSASRTIGLVKDGRIIKHKVGGKKNVEKLLSSDVDVGEAECFMCCLKEGIKLLVLDDVDAAYSLEGLAKSQNIKLKISVAVIVELVNRNLIKRKKAYSAVKKMVKVRRWEGGVLEVLSEKYLKKM